MTKCFKIVSGETILADVVNQTGEFVQLKNPLAMLLAGEGQLMLVQYLPLSNSDECIIETKHIVLSYEPKPELVSHYKQRTGGIVPASPSILGQLDNWRK